MAKLRLPLPNSPSRRRQGKSPTKVQIKQAVDPYVVSFETERIRPKATRHHWIICSVQNPDQLVSWGHSTTHELAETEARNEVENLSSGQTHGGHVTSRIKPFAHRVRRERQ